MTNLAGHIAVINCCLPGTVRNEIFRVLDGAAGAVMELHGTRIGQIIRGHGRCSHHQRKSRQGSQGNFLYQCKLPLKYPDFLHFLCIVCSRFLREILFRVGALVDSHAVHRSRERRWAGKNFPHKKWPAILWQTIINTFPETRIFVVPEARNLVIIYKTSQRENLGIPWFIREYEKLHKLVNISFCFHSQSSYFHLTLLYFILFEG